MGKEVLLRGNRTVEPKKGVMFDAGLPEVLTGPVVHHVKTQHSISRLIL